MCIVFHCVLSAMLFEFVNSDCGVVRRKEWGAKNAKHVSELKQPVNVVIIHHTDTDACFTDKTCEDQVREIQNYQMNILNYADIGSSFLIGGNGRVYEGSGWRNAGFHTRGFDKQSIEIAFIGHFHNNRDEPTEEAIEAAKALISCGIKRGHLSKRTHVIEHEQVDPDGTVWNQLIPFVRLWPWWLKDASILKKTEETGAI